MVKHQKQTHERFARHNHFVQGINAVFIISTTLLHKKWRFNSMMIFMINDSWMNNAEHFFGSTMRQYSDNYKPPDLLKLKNAPFLRCCLFRLPARSLIQFCCLFCSCVLPFAISFSLLPFPLLHTYPGRAF